MASRQRDTSVSELFLKNVHLLGFDSQAKAALATVKEAVDITLDACEEADMLLEIWVEFSNYCFVDCDPCGFANIYSILKAGSGNAAHINQFYCAPRARFLGVTPQDIIDYGLEHATHPLLKTGIKRTQDAIKNDPFFAVNPEWIAAINQLLTMGVRAEQQALAKWGLNYVVNEYLPRKLADQASFLP